MEPSGLTSSELAQELHLSRARLDEVLRGDRRMDGDLDLRLSRYFGVSEGFFLRLQDSFELPEAKRALNGALEHIVPRAA